MKAGEFLDTPFADVQIECFITNRPKNMKGF